MSERDNVEEIIGYMELDDLLVIHGVQTVWSNGKKSRVYTGQDKTSFRNTKEDGFRKMVSILVEVRDE